MALEKAGLAAEMGPGGVTSCRLARLAKAWRSPAMAEAFNRGRPRCRFPEEYDGLADVVNARTGTRR